MLKILENFDFIDFNWECPYCKTKTTIVNGNCSRDFHVFDYFVLKTEYILCPNKDCKKITIKASLLNISDILIDSIDYSTIRNVHQKPGAIPIWEKTLQPDIPNAMALPEYIPESLREDYYEAYKGLLMPFFIGIACIIKYGIVRLICNIFASSFFISIIKLTSFSK